MVSHEFSTCAVDTVNCGESNDLQTSLLTTTTIGYSQHHQHYHMISKPTRLHPNYWTLKSS